MCTLPLLDRVCRESYNDPREVYDTLKRRGMDLVTVTDHDSIEALDSLARHTDFFLSEEVIDRMLERGTFLVPTLTALHRILEHGEEGGIPAFMVAKSRRCADAQIASVRRAHRAGVPIAAGTDGGTPFNPHEDLATELELLVKVGLTPAQALLSATSVAASVLGLSDEIGTVEPGKRADLVVLGADPLADIGAVRDVRLVISAGRIVEF